MFYNHHEKKTLKEWADLLELEFVIQGGRELYYSKHKKERNGFISIYNSGGYGIAQDEFHLYLDKIFLAQNVDINDLKLVECY